MSAPAAKLKIAIVGSGPSAFGTLLGLLDSGNKNCSVTLFDANPLLKEDLPVQDGIAAVEYYNQIYSGLKKEYGLKFPPIKTHLGVRANRYECEGQKIFFKSEYFGGLSNFWGGTMLPFDESSFNGWPVSKKEMEPHYEAVSKKISIAGAKDSLNAYLGEDYVSNPPMRSLKIFSHLNECINKNARSETHTYFAGANRVALDTDPASPHQCIYCGECMAGCFKNSIFNAASGIHALSQQFPEFKTANVHITKILLDSRKLEWKDSESESFDRIFLCAGCPSSTEIVMRSLGVKEGPVIHDNVIAQFPIVYTGESIREQDEKYNSLSNSIVIAAPHNHLKEQTYQIQFYPNFDYLWRSAMPETFWRLLNGLGPATRGRILWARMYPDSSNGYQYSVRLNESDKIEFRRYKTPLLEPIRQAISDFSNTLKGSGFHIPPISPVLSKTSSHLAGSLAFNTSVISVDSMGEISKGVHICDSSLFPSSPAISPTFTIMANSHRIAFQTSKS